ncbi:MAG: hypothetical protein GF334_12590 [Candidatus Altiarchaeales archaeon]|nr:hypothetical protein [Candidatus Altiarchaeales archaeon]
MSLKDLLKKASEKPDDETLLNKLCRDLLRKGFPKTGTWKVISFSHPKKIYGSHHVVPESGFGGSLAGEKDLQKAKSLEALTKLGWEPYAVDHGTHYLRKKY